MSAQGETWGDSRSHGSFQLIAAYEAKQVFDILSASSLLLESKDKCSLPTGAKPGENLRPMRRVFRSG